jgi:hypothetical protein
MAKLTNLSLLKITSSRQFCSSGLSWDEPRRCEKGAAAASGLVVDNGLSLGSSVGQMLPLFQRWSR